MAQSAPRKNHLAAIHIAHKALGLSKDDACALKQAVTGVASAGDMTEQQRKRYLAHLSGLQNSQILQRGGTVTYVPKRSDLHRSIDDDQDARWHKARALWAALAAAGEVHTNTDEALMAYVRRQTRLTHWRFLNGYQVTSLIEALKRWCLRVGVPTHA